MLHRLRTKLVLIVLLAMLPAVGLQIMGELKARAVRERQVRDQALQLARLVGGEQQRIVEAAVEVLNVIAGAPAVQDGWSEVCSRMLANMVHQSPRYSGAVALGLDGRPTCYSGAVDPRIMSDFRSYFQLALATGGPVVGEFQDGRRSGRAELPIARPFSHDDGTPAGVVAVTLAADWLQRQLEGVGLPPDAVAAVLDSRGTVLARLPADPGVVGHPARVETLRLLAGGPVGVDEFTDREGRRMLLAHVTQVPMPGGLRVLVGLDWERMVAQKVRADRLGVLFIVLGVLLAIGATLAFGDRLIGRPVERLLTAAARWGGGDLDARTGMKRDGSEFGRLGAAFDGMAIALAERERAMQESDAALRLLTAELESRVRMEVQAREEAQMRAARAERVQALGQLAGGIAHDFNNVMQTVMGAASLIRVQPGVSDAVARLAQRVLDAGERGISVTRRLLAFARRGNLRAEPVKVADLLDGLREMLAHTLGSPIFVQVSVAADVGCLLADKGQLETVLVNLATNARDAMPAGGRLSLSATAATVAAGAEDGNPDAPLGLAPGAYVRIAVADTGVGMDRATLARAEEPFFTTKSPGLGTGLGLSMARGFADQSGGGLRIASAPGAGTTVALWLPAAPAEAASPAAEAADPPAAPARRGTHVLLVDDDPDVLDVLGLYLENSGLATLRAASGEEALVQLAAGEPVDVLVTDYSMSGMDGLALIGRARALRPGLPALLLTGYSGDTAKLATHDPQAGGFSLLLKPVRGQALLARIESLLPATAAGD